MSISLRATSTGPNSNATSTSINLPSGTTTGDVTYICGVQGTSGTLTLPSGWTTIYLNGAAFVIRRVYQGGDPSSVSITSSASGWWETAAVSYSGIDTSTPEDTTGSCTYYMTAGALDGTDPRPRARAPSLNPNYNGSQLVSFFMDPHISGFTMSAPTGMTRQTFSGAGPSVMIADLALIDGSSTGDKDTMMRNEYVLHHGINVAVKSSGASAATLASARPVFSSIHVEEATASTFVARFDNVVDDDLLCVWIDSVETISTPTGWTQRSANQGAYLFTRRWTTGDPTTETFSKASGNWHVAVACAFRKSGVSSDKVAIDKIVTGSSSGSVSLAAQTPTVANEIAFFLAGTRTIIHTVGTIGGVSPGSLVQEILNNDGPITMWGYKDSISASYGPFQATLTPGSGDDSNDGVAVLLGVLAESSPPASSGPQMILIAT